MWRRESCTDFLSEWLKGVGTTTVRFRLRTKDHPPSVIPVVTTPSKVFTRYRFTIFYGNSSSSPLGHDEVRMIGNLDKDFENGMSIYCYVLLVFFLDVYIKHCIIKLNWRLLLFCVSNPCTRLSTKTLKEILKDRQKLVQVTLNSEEK